VVFIFLLTVFPVLLTGCFTGGRETKGSKDKSVAERTITMDTLRLSRIVVPHNAAYSAVLGDLDPKELQNIDLALTIYSNNRADSLSRDSMLITFDEFMTSVIQGYYDKKISGNQELFDHFRNKEEHAEGQKLVSRLASHGINLFFRDGEFYMEPELSFIYNRLNNSLTTGSRNYLQTRMKVAKGFGSDGDVPMSAPDSIACLVIAWEDCMIKNPGYLRMNEIQSQYIDALTSYLTGSEQLPLFDTGTKVLDPKFKVSYLRFIKEHPDRESGKIVGKFYDLLSSKGFRYDEELDAFLSEVNMIPTQNPQ
jgi:hypothetical protein